MNDNSQYIALIGNPNSGKTAIFNLLTGMDQKVSNYPGVTVDIHYGTSKISSKDEIEIMDLLTNLNKKNNQIFVIVSHSDYVGGRTNRIIKMKDGKVVKK